MFSSQHFLPSLLAASLCFQAAGAQALKPQPSAKASSSKIKPAASKEVPFCGIHLVPKRSHPRAVTSRGAGIPEFSEVEPNNSINTATAVPLGRSSNQVLTLFAGGSTGTSNANPFVTNVEDNGSIPFATETGMTGLGSFFTSSEISSQPSTGDIDVFSFFSTSGNAIEIVADASDTLDTFLTLYNSSGEVLATNDDFDGTNSLLNFEILSTGTYFVAVSAYSSTLSDPFDSASGSGLGSIGSYNLSITQKTVTVFTTNNEDNGSIPQATATGVTPDFEGFVRTNSTISDSPDTGDFDFFSMEVMRGQNVVIDAVRSDPEGSLDSLLVLYDSSGNVIASNDDVESGNVNSRIGTTFMDSGTVYIAVQTYDMDQSDPFDSTSGTGVQSTGDYSLLINVGRVDFDFFEFDVLPGEVFTANVLNGPILDLLLFNPDGSLRQSTSNSVTSFSAPPQAPFDLFVGSNPSMTTILEEAGRYRFAALGGITAGEYEIAMRLTAPGLVDQPEGARQILFVDFDGATVDTRPFGGSIIAANLSPMNSFLDDWGLNASDESAVIDAILEVINDRLVADLAASGYNGDYFSTGTPGDFGIEIRNSRDHADPFGLPNVSRMIVGGTIAESGLDTIGIAESIDVGNYITEETALVLLDILSAPIGQSSASINQYPIGSGFSKIDAIGRAVGLVVAHEAGHFFGCWHTNQFNEVAEIMDQGGNAPQLFGIGPDAIWGTADDTQTRFGVDTFNDDENIYTGFENTQALVAFGLSTGSDGVFNQIPVSDSWMLF